MRKAAIVVLVIVALLGGWLLGVYSWYRSVQPAGATLAEHLAQRPAPEQRRIIIADRKEFLALFGPIQAFPRLPSGWPVYIFDSAGQLVDWTPDEGDDEAFKRRWPGVLMGWTITPEEVGAWPGSGQ
jgi:hypothetical protein